MRIARWAWIALAALGAIGLGVTAFLVLTDDGEPDEENTPTPIESVERPAVSHECLDPGDGWTLVVSWERPTTEVAWSPDGGTTWEPMEPIDEQSWRHDGLPPSEVSLVRIRYELDGNPTEGLLTERSPETAC